MLDGPSGNVAVVSEASLKPNDLAQPDIGRQSLHACLGMRMLIIVIERGSAVLGAL